jgi:hypothetical protein
MAEKQATNGQSTDPADSFRQLRDNYLDAWAKSMVEVVNTDAYAKATGALLDTYLSVSSPFRETMEKALVQTLAQLSMPSRADVVSLAERLTNLELKIDDIDAKLDQLVGPARPSRRTRRPARRGARKGAK